MKFVGQDIQRFEPEQIETQTHRDRRDDSITTPHLQVVKTTSMRNLNSGRIDGNVEQANFKRQTAFHSVVNAIS